MTFKVSSRLVSLNETNFSPAEFEIPAGYTNMLGALPPTVMPSPHALGLQHPGADNFEGVRRELENGRAILTLPKTPATGRR